MEVLMRIMFMWIPMIIGIIWGFVTMQLISHILGMIGGGLKAKLTQAPATIRVERKERMA